MSITTDGDDFEQYKARAKDLLKQVRAGAPEALARMAASHPEHSRLSDAPVPQLADTQLVVARESGAASWVKLKEHVLLLRAVRLLDSGDSSSLLSLIEMHPRIVRYRIGPGDGGYFAHATLLHHVAGNPIRCSLPPNIIEIARLLLIHGSDPNATCGVPGNLSTTVGLLLTSHQASEAGVSVPLIDLLKEFGAADDVSAGSPGLLDDPLWNGGLETARALAARGAAVDLPQAAALGRLDIMRRILAADRPDSDLVELALIYACAQQQLEAAELLLAHGAHGDVIPAGNRRGAGQATALHNAAWRGDSALSRLLLENGAGAAVRDRRWEGTAADWAEHGGHAQFASLLRRREQGL